MDTFHRFFAAGVLTGLSLVDSSAVLADELYQPQYQQPKQHYQQQPRQRSYGEKVGDKAKNGFTNIATSWLEIPKSIINDTNAEGSNIVFGIVGGTIEGALHGVSRLTSGVTDLITAPLATKPIINPQYIWEDFDETTTYGQVFRLDDH